MSAVLVLLLVVPVVAALLCLVTPSRVLWERVNLAARPDQATQVAAFRAEVARRWSLDTVHGEVLASQRRRHLVYAALREGRYTPWDFQPQRDASRLYVRNDQELNDLEAMARFPRITP